MHKHEFRLFTRELYFSRLFFLDNKATLFLSCKMDGINSRPVHWAGKWTQFQSNLKLAGLQSTKNVNSRCWRIKRVIGDAKVLGFYNFDHHCMIISLWATDPYSKPSQQRFAASAKCAASNQQLVGVKSCRN